MTAPRRVVIGAVVTGTAAGTIVASARLSAHDPRTDRATDAVNHGALVTDPVGQRRGGLWIVSPSGGVERILRRGSYPLAVGGLNRIALNRRGGSGPIKIVKGKRRVVLPHSDRKSVCAAWSAHGRRLAYVVGKGIVYKRFRRLPGGGDRNVAFAIRGRLSVAKASRPRRAKRVASGLFPECPAWSPRGQTLAYLVRRESGRRAWRLRVRSGGSARTVAGSRSSGLACTTGTGFAL